MKKVTTRRHDDDLVRTESVGEHVINYHRRSIGAVVVEVPSYVRRIDCNGTEGWQCVFKRLDTPYFSAFENDRGDLELALTKITRRLKNYLVQTPNLRRCRLMDSDDRRVTHLKTGHANITVAWVLRRRTDRHRPLFYLNILTRKTQPSGRATNQTLYVCSEDTFDYAKLRHRLQAAILSRRFYYLTHLDTGFLAPKPKANWSLPNITEQQLKEDLISTKTRMTDTMSKAINDYVPTSLCTKPIIHSFRKTRIVWRSAEVNGQTLWVPDFIEQVGDTWEALWTLITGAVYGDTLDHDGDAHDALRTLVCWCFEAQATSISPSIHPSN
jgi:hypothetical protein